MRPGMNVTKLKMYGYDSARNYFMGQRLNRITLTTSVSSSKKLNLTDIEFEGFELNTW